MGVGIIVGKEQGTNREGACLFCSVTGFVFGEVFREEEFYSAEEVAEEFLEWHFAEYGDPRNAKPNELVERKYKFLMRIRGEVKI